MQLQLIFLYNKYNEIPEKEFMKFYYLIAVITLTIFGCKDEVKKTEGDFTYFGGEVISPINDVVILSYADKIIDTLKLNSKNRFLYKFKDFKTGLYSFSLQSAITLEYQTVFLEPNDSIIFRLNTSDFDESLVYTGIGAKKNNYFINEFLQNEINEKKIYKYCLLSPEKFESKIDSLKQIKYKKLDAFKNKYKTSNLFNKIAKTNIDVSYYSSKEIYPIMHYRHNKKDIINAIPKDFYSYRKTINYNDEFLKNDYNYIKFLRNSSDNQAIRTHLVHSNNEPFSRWSLCYNLDRLTLIDSLIVNTQIKDDLLYNYTIDYLTKSKNAKNNEAILNFYLSKSKNATNKEFISSYALSIDKLRIGDKLPNVSILNFNNEVIDINTLISSPTVMSFWSNKHYSHFKESHKKIKELKVKYPEVRFIAINVDECGLPTLKKSLKINHFAFDDEYKFKDSEHSIKTLAIQPITKTIIIDKHKKIVNSNTNIFSLNFEEQLLGLINR